MVASVLACAGLWFATSKQRKRAMYAFATSGPCHINHPRLTRAGLCGLIAMCLHLVLQQTEGLTISGHLVYAAGPGLHAARAAVGLSIAMAVVSRRTLQ